MQYSQLLCIGLALTSALYAPPTTNLAIFVSGTGTNMAAILDAQIPEITPCLVLSNKKNAPALEKAIKRGVPTVFLDSRKKENPNPDDYTNKLIACLNEHNITPENGLICLAGFMKLLDAQFVRHFKHRIINIHPSLLPSFKGMDAIKQAMDYGAKVAGCTVHFVDEGMDTGPIILQAATSINEDDTQDTVEEKVHILEHRIFPCAVQLFAQNRLVIEERKVHIK